MKIRIRAEMPAPWPAVGETVEVSDAEGHALIQNGKAVEIVELELRPHEPIETAMIVPRENTARRTGKPKAR
jgi:hypothetical protein